MVIMFWFYWKISLLIPRVGPLRRLVVMNKKPKVVVVIPENVALRDSILVYFTYADYPSFSLFSAEIGKLKIFLPPRLFCPFSLLLAPFFKTYQFQITLLFSMTYLKNTPSPTRLQRLPRSKKCPCDPL